MAVDEATEKAVGEAFRLMYETRDENFGNARDVRNIFEQAVARQANRVAAMENPGREDLMALTEGDLGLVDQPETEKAALLEAPAEPEKSE